MKTTWGNRESIDINDKEYTKVCSFLKNGCKIDINTDLEKYKELTEFTQPAAFYLDAMKIENIFIRLLGKAFYLLAPILARNKIISVLKNN